MKMTEIIERAKRSAKLEDKQQSIVSFLSDIGNVPDELQKRIEAENDMTVLDKWLKLSARSDSFESFEKNM